jgi:SET domain-containing protein
VVFGRFDKAGSLSRIPAYPPFFRFPKHPRSCEIIDVPLVVRPSPIHSVGVYTTTAIRKGARVVEYDGRRITPEEADRLYENAERTYLYGLEDGKTVIDGEGIGAYLNHSCEPNCEVDEIKGRVWIFAIRDIGPGEELVWDYNLYDDEDPAPCYCGAKKCRGTMYSREWMAKMRRREARLRKKQEEKNGARPAA